MQTTHEWKIKDSKVWEIRYGDYGVAQLQARLTRLIAGAATALQVALTPTILAP